MGCNLTDSLVTTRTAALLLRNVCFNSRPVHVELVMDKVALGLGFHREFRFSPCH